MKAILSLTAVATAAGIYADSGSILANPDDVSAEKADELVTAGMAVEHVEEAEEAPKSKAKA